MRVLKLRISNIGQLLAFCNNWKIELALGNKEDLLKAGREKYKESVGRPPSKSLSTTDNNFQPETNPEKHNTRDERATEVGVSNGPLLRLYAKKNPNYGRKQRMGQSWRIWEVGLGLI